MQCTTQHQQQHQHSSDLRRRPPDHADPPTPPAPHRTRPSSALSCATSWMPVRSVTSRSRPCSTVSSAVQREGEAAWVATGLRCGDRRV